MSRNKINRNDIGAVRALSIETPDFGEPFAPSDRNIALAQRIKDLLPAELLLSADYYPSIPLSKSPKASFTLDPLLSEGRDRSRQGVYFGRLAVSSDLDPHETAQVAVKPFDRRAGDLKMRPEVAVVHEWSANAHLNRIRTGSAYQPIGVWRDPVTDFIPRLVTEYHQRSTSLDNIFRAQSLDDDGRDGMARWARFGLTTGYYSLGFLHGARITHGDAMPQNFAYRGGRVIIFNDTTTFRPHGANEKKVRERLQADSELFSWGLFHPGASSEEMREKVVTLLTEPAYRATLYRAYVDGAIEGADRGGFTRSGLIVPEKGHSEAISRAIREFRSREGSTHKRILA